MGSEGALGLLEGAGLTTSRLISLHAILGSEQMPAFSEHGIAEMGMGGID